LFTQVKHDFSADSDPPMSARLRDSNHAHFVSCDTYLPEQKSAAGDAGRRTGVNPGEGRPRPGPALFRANPPGGQRIA
jgi:hypothetical protein